MAKMTQKTHVEIMLNIDDLKNLNEGKDVKLTFGETDHIIKTSASHFDY